MNRRLFLVSTVTAAGAAATLREIALPGEAPGSKMEPQMQPPISHGRSATCRDTFSVRQQREKLITELFPKGVPRLWCPTLTHFRAKGELNEMRIRHHLNSIAPYVKGILVPGSTGEGWEMSDDDIRRLLAVVLDAARPLGVKVLIGVLKYTVSDMVRSIDSTMAWLMSRTGMTMSEDAATARSGVVGFTVCPPKGREFSQTELHDALCRVLDRRSPTALYQLPQVTGNEMSPEIVASLAVRYPNFYLFKDTSGQDRVATSGVETGGVFLVRGAEGGYANWTHGGNGPYDGFLLSTANVFAPQLHTLLDLLDRGQGAEAQKLSGRIETVVKQTFALVADFPTGNAFTNANKVLDHVMAYGAAARDQEPPLLYSGVRLPAEFVEQAAAFLRAAGLVPDPGYLRAPVEAEEAKTLDT